MSFFEKIGFPVRHYLVLNNQQGHYETSGLPGFTGIAPADRVQAAGFSASSINAYGYPSEDETIVPSTNVLTGTGAMATRELLSAPYHLQGSFRGTRNVGFSILLASTVVPSANYVMAVINLATANTSQLPSSDAVLTYPCQGTNGVNYRLAHNEVPAPIAGRNLVVSPIGHPILVAVRNGNLLGITDATLINVSTGVSVTLRAPYTQTTDTVNSRYYYANEGFILPDAPLEPSTQYQATINGTNNGAVFSRTFIFTTGIGG